MVNKVEMLQAISAYAVREGIAVRAEVLNCNLAKVGATKRNCGKTETLKR